MSLIWVTDVLYIQPPLQQSPSLMVVDYHSLLLTNVSALSIDCGVKWFVDVRDACVSSVPAQNGLYKEVFASLPLITATHEYWKQYDSNKLYYINLQFIQLKWRANYGKLIFLTLFCSHVRAIRPNLNIKASCNGGLLSPGTLTTFLTGAICALLDYKQCSVCRDARCEAVLFLFSGYNSNFNFT